LIASIPDMARMDDRLFSIEGTPPALGRLPTGCAFHPRCPQAQDLCRHLAPQAHAEGDHSAACHFAFQNVASVA
ncbi:MAG: oligopeptide ABC transporter ATP-binding protein OppD, partial [Tabrizicola sp.]|nr:oligopeptide ABC transporter ATP-binding protein OppD [Tabrizicola sp.]